MNSTLSSNVSSNNSEQTLDTLQVAINIAYIITGFSSAITNMVILQLFFLYKSLRRKEILILFGLVTGDFVYGAAYLIAGIRRLQLVLKNKHTLLVTRWSCQKEPATFLIIFGGQ